MDVRLYLKRKERDEECLRKMQESRQFEMGGANIITFLLFLFWEQYCTAICNLIPHAGNANCLLQNYK